MHNGQKSDQCSLIEQLALIKYIAHNINSVTVLLEYIDELSSHVIIGDNKGDRAWKLDYVPYVTAYYAS